MVKTLSDIAGHLDMLDLIAPHRHLMCVKNENVSCHQYRVGKQSHRDAKIGVFARGFIGLHNRFVCVRCDSYETAANALGLKAVR